MGHDVPIVLEDMALGQLPALGRVSGMGDSQCHSVTCTAPGLLPHQRLPCHQPPVPLWGPWCDKDLPMAAASKAAPAEKITQRYKSS